MTCPSARMLRRSLLCAGAFTLTSLGLVMNAHATTGLLPSGATTPIEQRVAVAVGPSRTTVWTSLRAQTASGPLGLVIPVPAGATLDHSSDAWLEALDAATAPRVFPPAGSSLVCPGEPPNVFDDPFHVTSDLGKTASIAPSESKLLADPSAVVVWANSQGLAVPAAVANALNEAAGMSFFVERFNAPAGPFVTSTLRIVLPNATPTLPLALPQAGDSPLRITTWFVGTGRATITGSTPIKLHLENLSWNASSQDSNYVELRASELGAAGPSAVLTEATSHDALVKNIPIANGKGAITGLVTGYFERAASYLDADENFAPCITNAAVALDSTVEVAESCPRADLGVVGGFDTCTEAPAPSQIDPAKLRCGGRADDLAIALSGLVPANTWLTRTTMLIAKEAPGQTWPLAFTTVAPKTEPLLTATSVDFAECNGGSSSSSSSSGSPWDNSSSSGSSSSTGTYDPPNYNSDMACGCAGTAEPVIIDDTGAGGTGGEGGDYYTDTSSDDCSGDTSDTYVDSTSDTTYSDTTSEDCGGDTTDTSTDTTSDSESSSDDCSGDTTDTTDSYSETTYQDYYYSDTSSESDGIDCSGDTGDSSSDSSDCTVAHRPKSKGHSRGPKASVLTLGLLAILAPLRRMSRPRREARDRKDKPQAHRS